MKYQIIRTMEYRNESQCTGKEGYDLRTARQKVNVLHKLGRFKTARIYQCPDCSRWHIARKR